MLSTVFTLDYEIHGNGDGDPLELMVAPTERLLRLFDEYGARLTIMADVAEILKFKEHALSTGRDGFSYERIEQQLKQAVIRGHDVQLHIHSSYFNARLEKGGWRQDWSEYDFARLPAHRIDWMVLRGKEYLETLLGSVDSAYRCIAFRAANWSISPSANVVAALLRNQIRIDTSVFKYGQRKGLVQFDYTGAHSALEPWPANAEDICERDDAGQLWEFPIYAELRGVLTFATPQRLHRAFVGRQHRVSAGARPAGAGAERPAQSRWAALRSALGRHAWKADFNQCSSVQLINALERAHQRHGGSAVTLPFVLIGHSKLFTRYNEGTLRGFLAHVRLHPDRFAFGRFGDFPLPDAPSAEGPALPSAVLGHTDCLDLTTAR